jgi:predicted O-methyltransferase YrrM
MFRVLRERRRLARRRRDIARKIDRLAQLHPGLDWQPFRDVSDFFADKSLSAVEEQAFLYRLAHGLPSGAQVIEIGSWMGHGTCTLASPLKGDGARCFAVDTFAGGSTIDPTEKANFKTRLAQAAGGSQREMFDAHIARFGLTQRVQAVVGDSREAVTRVPLAAGTADLIFVDGGHDLETVRDDIRNYLPFLKPGGVAAFHDFSSACGVPTALWEAIEAGSFADLLGIHGSLIAFRKA